MEPDPNTKITPRVKTSAEQSESSLPSKHVEIDFFVFPPEKIQGFYFIDSTEDEEGNKTEPCTVVHLEGWVCPISRPDGDKKLYYYLRKTVKPTLIKL